MKFIAKTLYGLEKVLTEELESLGAGNIRPANRAVLFSGDKELIYKANYSLRSALSILVQIADFSIRSKDDLYKRSIRIDWSQIMDASDTFTVVPVINSKLFTHTGYPALVVKDAVADYFRQKTGKRPSIDSRDPVIVINLHISGDRVTISLDSSGEPLFKRGYRTDQGPAPLNEVLAAGILLISGWNATVPLTDPMCGSGTIPIEAAMIACHIPPGRTRSEYGFCRWKDYDPEMFTRIKGEYESRILRSPVKISASDISEEAVKQSIVNINKAGVGDEIKTFVSDFSSLRPADREGYIFINPPYGQRLKPEEINRLYSMIGTSLKYYFAGYKAWIITTGKEFLRNIGLKPDSKHTLFNGAIECILAGYTMYEGSVKQKSDIRKP